MADSEIVVGVTGGIAAYKTAHLVSRLVQRGLGVRVVMTRAASQFIGPATFAALTGRASVVDTFDEAFPLGAHIELARAADLLCVAPASADFLAKAAHGLADDLLSTLYLCFRGPVIVAPAMNTEMWTKPSVERNVQQLVDDGVNIVAPGEGWLSCRERGPGRMAEPADIFRAIANVLGWTGADAELTDS
jgi:phosphopantothenoylcysteine decarboxylase/phosphopantothenate--cysteine ligase